MTQALCKLEQILSQLEAEVRDELSRHSDRELMEILAAHMHQPVGIVMAAIVGDGGGKLCTMAAVTIFRERIRRQQVAALEEATT